MTQEGLQVGQLVRSKAGRDAGRFFLVVGVKNSREVVIADGTLRKVARPKLKNVRHLEIYPVTVKDAEARFAPESVVTDRFVAEAIGELLSGLGMTGTPTAAERGVPAAGPTGGGGAPEEESGQYGQERRDRG